MCLISSIVPYLHSSSLPLYESGIVSLGITSFQHLSNRISHQTSLYPPLMSKAIIKLGFPCLVFFSIWDQILRCYNSHVIPFLKPTLHFEVTSVMIFSILWKHMCSLILWKFPVLAIGLVVLKQGYFRLYFFLFLSHCISNSLASFMTGLRNSSRTHSLRKFIPHIDLGLVLFWLFASIKASTTASGRFTLYQLSYSILLLYSLFNQFSLLAHIFSALVNSDPSMWSSFVLCLISQYAKQISLGEYTSIILGTQQGMQSHPVPFFFSLRAALITSSFLIVFINDRWSISISTFLYLSLLNYSCHSNLALALASGPQWTSPCLSWYTYDGFCSFWKFSDVLKQSMLHYMTF